MISQKNKNNIKILNVYSDNMDNIVENIDNDNSEKMKKTMIFLKFVDLI